MIRRLAAMAALGAAILCLSWGCSPGVTKVDVKVTMDGAPLSDASVVFTSDQNKVYTGVTDANGVARMKEGTKDGVADGVYKVAISKLEAASTTGDNMQDMKAQAGNLNRKQGPGGAVGPPGPGASGPPKNGAGKSKSLIPEKYGDMNKSGFTYTVPTDSKGVKEFSLTKDGK